MSKDPAFLFYVNDYLGGTMGFSKEMHGAYLIMLLFQFNNGPFSDDSAISVVGETWNLIQHKFNRKNGSGLRFNERLECEIERRKNFSTSRREIALKRWKKNDKPLSGKKINDMRMHTICNADAMHMGNETRTRTRTENKGDKSVREGEDFFDKFWNAYPKKRDKGHALKAWEKIKSPSETLQKIITALDWQKDSPDWTKDNGQYIPYPATYLNGRRWEDSNPENEHHETQYERVARLMKEGKL